MSSSLSHDFETDQPPIKEEGETEAAAAAATGLAPDQGQRNASAVQRITALGEMTGGIAHDFRNLLAVIQSGIRLANDSFDDPAKLRICLAAADQGVARGLRLTSRLLAFAKPREFESKPQDLNMLLRELEIFLKYGAGPDIRIALDLAPRLPKCLVDPSRFNAAILNLVVNARDAMPRGGAIHISTEMLVDVETPPFDPDFPVFVRVRVKDSGEGMTPDVLHSIFDPFFTTKGDMGTGLGIPQVAAFIKSTGGRISVESEVGTGSEFDLQFPASAKTAPVCWRRIDRWANEGGVDAPVSPFPGV